MSGKRTMLYVSCGGTQQIVRFSMDGACGALTKLGETHLPGGPHPAEAHGPGAGLRSNGAPLTANPQGTVLYAATRTEPSLARSWRISPEDGTLTAIGEAPTVYGTPYVATDRTGRFLLGAAHHPNKLWVSRIGEDGAVHEAPVQVIEGMTTAHCVLFHSSNAIAYVACTGLAGIQIFRFEPGDMPLSDRRSAPASTPDATPRHLAMRPDERFLYCMNETSSIVDVFAVGEGGGALSHIQSADLRPADARDGPGLGADIIVSADGRSLYCTERIRGTVAVFAIDAASGKLSPVQTVPMGKIPRSIALDPSGRFLASAMQGDGAVLIHAVSAKDGSLTHAGTYETGGTPIWVEFVTLP
jgi:6-phosphogluconolactonase